MTERHIIPFSFESQSVRVIDQEGEPWFVLVDVCAVLDLSNPSKAASALDEDERMTLTISEGHEGQRGGAQFQTIVNESGLWSLVFRSRKPQAKRFRRWVTGEVIPSIRKHGGYSMINDAPALNDGVATVREARLSFGKIAGRQMWKRLGLPMVPAMMGQGSSELYPWTMVRHADLDPA